jgi:hypothetical protein
MQPFTPSMPSFAAFKENPDIYILGMSESEKGRDFILTGDDPELAQAINHPDFHRHVSQLPFFQPSASFASQEIDIAIIPSSEYVCISLKGKEGWFNFLNPSIEENRRITLEKTQRSDAIDEIVRARFLKIREENEEIKKQCKDLRRWQFFAANEAYSFHYYRQKALEENCLLFELWEDNPLVAQPWLFEKIARTIAHFMKQLFYCLLATFKVPA